MSQTPSAPASFEAALSELEGIVAAMEGGQVPLKDAQLEIEVLEKGVLTAFKPDEA